LIQNEIEEQNILVEVESAANEIKNRPVFQKLMNKRLQENDLLIVTKIDRCSRNTLEFLKLQDILFKKTITFVALNLLISIDLATNKLIAPAPSIPTNGLSGLTGSVFGIAVTSGSFAFGAACGCLVVIGILHMQGK
jgi:hypothetical protein